MKINVVPRMFVKKMMNKDQNWYKDKWIISIFSTPICCPLSAFSPFPNASNVLKLQFDDVTEKDQDAGLKHFTPEMAAKIKEFISNIKDDGSKDFWVHCDAGVSRSGAVGYLLNEYFNKFLSDNRVDRNYYETENCVMPNPEVVRILKNELFGTDYRGIFVNDYTYDMYGDRHDNFKEVFLD